MSTTLWHKDRYTIYLKGGDLMEMDMQDSADMCSCMQKLNKLLRKRRWNGRAGLGRL
jgi:hypothetical protein